jgi:hypothetical protein
VSYFQERGQKSQQQQQKPGRGLIDGGLGVGAAMDNM